MTEKEERIIMLPSGKLFVIVELKELDLHRFWHDLIMEKILLSLNPDEPPHHYIIRDNLPIMLDA